MTVKELEQKREELARKNRKEYRTYGNTPKCQRLFNKMKEVEKQIEKLRR